LKIGNTRIVGTLGHIISCEACPEPDEGESKGIFYFSFFIFHFAFSPLFTHLLIFSSSHLLIFSSSHLHIFWFLVLVLVAGRWFLVELLSKSEIRNQKSDIRHPTSDIRPLAPSPHRPFALRLLAVGR